MSQPFPTPQQARERSNESRRVREILALEQVRPAVEQAISEGRTSVVVVDSLTPEANAALRLMGYAVRADQRESGVVIDWSTE